MLCVFGTVIFLLEGSIKRSKANLKIPGRRKNECREIKKTGMRIMLVVFYAILAHPSHMQFLLKHKSHKHKTQISYSKHNVAYRLP